MKNELRNKKPSYRCRCPSEGLPTLSYNVDGLSAELEPQHPETVQFCHCSGSNGHSAAGEAVLEKIEWQGVSDAVRDGEDCIWLRSMWWKVLRTWGCGYSDTWET